jgi:hypothetical protein
MDLLLPAIMSRTRSWARVRVRAVVSRTINRGCNTDETASVRALPSRSTTAATARLACSRGSWVTEVRSMWLSCASRLLSSR